MDQTELLWAALGPRRDPLDLYIEKVVNNKLRLYRAIIQTGRKAGQTLYGHVFDGATLLARLADLLDVSWEELCCLLAAWTVHDLNKVPPYSESRARYPDIVTRLNVEKELIRLQIDGFFGAWREYLDDIVALARLHQGHLAVTDEGLNLRARPRYRLDWERIAQLGTLLQAVDVLLLSDELEETRIKSRFLVILNSASRQRRYQIITHHLAENRGILTNVLHNCLVAEISERFNAVPLLFYPDGVAYLIAETIVVHWDGEATTKSAARRVEKKLASLQSQELRQFIKGSNVGVQVDAAALESGADIQSILDTVLGIVSGYTYGGGKRDRITNDVREKDLLPALQKNETTPELSSLIQTRLAQQHLVPPDDEGLQKGELITAYQNLLSRHLAHALRASGSRTWTHLYRLCAVSPAQQALYDLIYPSRRGYVMAADLSEDLEAVYGRILEDARTVMAAGGDDTAEAGGPDFTDYLAVTLQISGGSPGPRDFRRHLQRYISDEHRQCCTCSTSTPTAEWMSANAPASIGVQSFSNRLEGGSPREPKRRICAICRSQFILERLAFRSHRDKQGAEQVTFYLHLFPKAFFTQPLLQSWWAEVQRLRDDGAGAFLVTDNAFRIWRADTEAGTSISLTKLNGVGLPLLAETQANTPVLPVTAPGENYGGQFLFALKTAVAIQRFFGCRVVLSRAPVPLVQPQELEVLCLDGVPRDLSWLVPRSTFVDGSHGSQDGHDGVLTAQGLFGRLCALQRLADLLYIPGETTDVVQDVVTAATDDPLAAYHVVDRLIEKKAAKGSGSESREMQATALARQAAPVLRDLLGEA